MSKSILDQQSDHSEREDQHHSLFDQQERKPRPPRKTIVDYSSLNRRERDQLAAESGSRPVMKMTQAAYQAIMQDLAYHPFQREEGGILLGPVDAEDLVVSYVKDIEGESRVASFSIDAGYLNRQIRKVKSTGLTCAGIVHSHPNGICLPSYGDLEFLRTIFSNPKNGGGLFLFPIVTSGKLFPFVVDTSDVSRVLSAELVLV